MPISVASQPVRAAERVIDLQAVLVRGFDGGSARRDVVVGHVTQRAGHKTRTIRHDDGSRLRDVLAGDSAEPLDGNSVAGKRIADESRATWIRSGRRRIVDNEQPALAVHPVRKIAVVHFRRRHTQRQRDGRGVVAESFLRGE